MVPAASSAVLIALYTRHVRVGTALAAAVLAVLVVPSAAATPLLEVRLPPPKVSYAKARKLLLRDVIRPASLVPGDDVVAFGLPRPLAAGQRVTPFLDRGPAFRAKGRWWFFWVDDDPLARFAHPTRYVYVNAVTGRLKVIEQEWWPLVDGTAPWFEFEDYWEPGNWAFSNLAPREPPPPAPAGSRSMLRGQAGEECAVLVDGAGDPKIGTRQDVDGMEAVMELFDFRRAVIHAPASKELLEEMVQWLVDSGCKDLLVYLTSHGDQQEILIGGRPYTAQMLKLLMARYPAVDFKVVVDACFAGSWIEPLGKRPKIVIASSNFDEVSYGANRDGPNDPNPQDEGGEFSSGLIEDLKAIPSDAALLTRVQECVKQGRLLFVCKLSLAWESAVEKDENAMAGKTTPRKVLN